MGFFPYIIITIFSLVVNLLFLRFIATKMKNNRALQFYFVGIIMTMIWQGFDLWASLSWYSNEIKLIIWKIADTAALIQVYCLLLFVNYLVKKKFKPYYHALINLINILVVATVFLSDRYIVGFRGHHFTRIQDIAGPYKFIHNFWLVFLFFIAIILLFNSYKKSKEEKFKKQILIIAWGAIASIVIAVTTDIIMPRLGIEFMLLGGIGSTMLIASIIIAIYRFQFLDIRPKRFTIGQKVVATFSVSMALAVIGITGYSFINGNKIALERESRHLNNAVYSRAKHIDYMINEYILDTKIVLAGIDFQSLLKSDDREKNIRRVEINEILRQDVGVHKDYLKISLLDERGTIYASSDDSSIDLEKKEIAEALKGKDLYVKDIHISKGYQVPAIKIAAPVIIDGGRIGGIIIDIDMSGLYNITNDRTGLKESGEMYLINQEGYMISPSRFITDSFLKQKIATSVKNSCFYPAEDPLQLNKPKIYLDYRGVEVVGTNTLIDSMPWCLIAEINKNESLEEVSSLRSRVYIISVIVILLIFLIGLLLARTITHPIRALVKASEEFTKGNLDYLVKINTRDELAVLARAYNSMIGNIKISQAAIEDYNKTLEKKVRGKTRELENILLHEQKDKKNLEEQRLATMNILEDVSESQEELENTYLELKQKSQHLNALKSFSEELTKVLDVEEIIQVINKYFVEFLKFSVVNYFVINPSEEGGIIYNSFLSESVSEEYISTLEEKLMKYLAKEKKGKMSASLKIIETVRPKYSGEKLDNSIKSHPKTIEFFPMLIGDKHMGIIQIASSQTNDFNKEIIDLINALVNTAAFSIDRLQTLIITQHSKTVSLIESLRDGVVMFNKKEEMVLMNPAFISYTGLSEMYFKMDDLYKLINVDDMKAMVKLTIKEGKMSQINEVILVDKHYEVLVTPVKDNRHQIVGGAIIFHDITYLKEVDKMKTEFVSVASHQLRTPLTAIKLFVEMLLEASIKGMSKKHIEYLHNIYQSSERMVLLVNDLLGLSRLESGRLKIEPIKVNIVNFVQNIIGEVKPVADSKKVKIEFDNEKKIKDIPLDKNLMRQVIHNLITNAVRYTATAKKALVEVNTEKKDKDLLITIKDNGIGIPKDVQPRIFEKFYRADNAVKTNTEGTGLGLYVSKMIVKASGGKIWFESEKDKGTTFFVSLPMSGMKEKEGDKSMPEGGEMSYS